MSKLGRYKIWFEEMGNEVTVQELMKRQGSWAGDYRRELPLADFLL